MSEFQTDALRPSSLPTASLGRRRHLDLADGAQNGVDTKFDKLAEEWNVRIDKEVKAVSSGLKELIELADIGDTPNTDNAQINALHLKLKTSQLIRSAQGIRDLAHELKLMLLLSDQVEEASRRDKEAQEVGREVEEGRKRVGEEVARLLGGGRSKRTPTPKTKEHEAGEGGVEGDRMEVDTTGNAPAQNQQKEEGIRTDDRMEDDDEDEDEDEGFEQVA